MAVYRSNGENAAGITILVRDDRFPESVNASGGVSKEEDGGETKEATKSDVTRTLLSRNTITQIY